MSINKSIKPNIFLFKNLTNEDHFTNSLGYILNLFPNELGKRFLSKLAELAGYSPDYFGEFVEAKFAGHYLQNEDSTSKPDLIIHTTKTKIYFEVKLKASLSKNQLERHFNDVEKEKGYLLLVSNIQTQVSEKLFLRKNYLRPKNEGHFIWSQFESVFYLRSPKGGLKEMILEDFKKSLRSNGIKGRQIIGTEDNLYTNGSQAENLVLDKLKAILKKIGFSAWRKQHEFTLRVNAEKPGKYPLLNPRIYPTGEWLDDSCIKECMIVHCFARDYEEHIIQILNNLVKLELTFPNLKCYDDYYSQHYIYYIYIPLEFLKVGSVYNLDWDYLEKVWRKIYELLKN